MDFLFSIFIEVFPPQPEEVTATLSSLFFHLLLNFLVFLQNIQFLWYHELDLPDWKNYQNFWLIISAPAIDKLLSSFSILTQFVYFILCTLVVTVSSLILISGLKFAKKRIPNYLRVCSRFSITMISHVLFIPFLLVLLQVGLSPEEDGIGSLSYGSSYRQDLDFGAFGHFLSIIGLIILGFITIFYEISCFEIRPQLDERFLSSKINAKTDLCIKLTQVINCCLTTYLTKSSYEVLLLYSWLAYGFNTYLILKNLPYYSIYLTFFQVYSQLSLSLIALFFIVGVRENNSALILLLTVIMQPTLGFIAYSLVNYRYKSVRKLHVSAHHDFPTLELSVRPMLRKDTEGTLLKKLNKNFSIKRSKENIISTAYYCNDTLLNCSLGLNKIFSISHKGFNLPLNYQIFKCKHIILKINKEHSLTYKIYRYITSLQKIKQKDQEYCSMYYKFFSVLLGKNVNLFKLKNFVVNIVNMCKDLENKYAKTLNEFPQSVEIKEMYGSFVCDLKGDAFKGQGILNKVWKSGAFHMSNISTIIKTKFFLIISDSEEGIGRITFASAELLSLLKLKKYILEEISLKILFPKAFYSYHEKQLSSFVESSESALLYDNNLIVFLDSQGYAYECIARAECIVRHETTNFIISVEPLINIREFALIYKDGLIYEHSLKFSEILGIHHPFVTRCSVQDLVPQINFSYLLKGHAQTITLDSGSKETVIIKIKKIKTVGKQFYFFYVIKEEEANRIGLDLDLFRDEVNIDEDENAMSECKTYKVQMDEEAKVNEKIEEKKVNNKSKLSSFTNNSSVLNAKETNSYVKSILVMNATKVILLVLVLSLISSNVAILVYMSQEVTHSITLQALLDLNYLSYSLAQLSLILRSKDVYSHLSKPQYYNDTYFEDMIILTRGYQDSLTKELDKWKYCPSSKIVTENIMSYWDVTSVKQVQKADLFAFVEFVIKNVIIIQARQAQSNMKSGKPYSVELMNVVSNTLEGPFDTVLETIDGLVTCETDRVDSLEKQKTYLLLIGIAVLTASIIIISLYLFASDKYLNNLWEHLRERGLAQSYKVREIISERMKNTHMKAEDFEIEEEKVLGQKSVPFKFKHSLHFLFKLSFLFLAAALFILLTTLYFYSNLKGYLYYRPLLVAAFPRRRVQMTELSFVILETYAITNNYSIEKYTPDFITLLPIKQSLKKKLDYVKATGKYINHPKTKLLMSDYLYNRIFYRVPEGSPYLSAGAYRGVAFLNQESNYFVHNGKPETFENINLFIDKMREFDTVIKGFSAMSHTDSKAIIENHLNNMILFIACFSALLLVSYIVGYYPLINREINVLRKLIKMLKLLPRTVSN